MGKRHLPDIEDLVNDGADQRINWLIEDAGIVEKELDEVTADDLAAVQAGVEAYRERLLSDQSNGADVVLLCCEEVKLHNETLLQHIATLIEYEIDNGDTGWCRDAAEKLLRINANQVAFGLLRTVYEAHTYRPESAVNTIGIIVEKITSGTDEQKNKGKKIHARLPDNEFIAWALSVITDLYNRSQAKQLEGNSVDMTALTAAAKSSDAEYALAYLTELDRNSPWMEAMFTDRERARICRAAEAVLDMAELTDRWHGDRQVWMNIAGLHNLYSNYADFTDTEQMVHDYRLHVREGQQHLLHTQRLEARRLEREQAARAEAPVYIEKPAETPDPAIAQLEARLPNLNSKDIRNSWPKTLELMNKGSKDAVLPECPRNYQRGALRLLDALAYLPEDPALGALIERVNALHAPGVKDTDDRYFVCGVQWLRANLERLLDADFEWGESGELPKILNAAIALEQLVASQEA